MHVWSPTFLQQANQPTDRYCQPWSCMQATKDGMTTQTGIELLLIFKLLKSGCKILMVILHARISIIKVIYRKILH